MNEPREHFASRLGFIFMTAGCAIGLGNIWRFPYVAGENGGGLFVLIYFLCLLFFGIPVLLMELSLGRAGQSTYPGAFARLKSPAARFPWHRPAYLLFTGNLILLMFYTVVTGWLFFYAFEFIRMNEKVYSDGHFQNLQASPGTQTLFMLIALAATVLICLGGIRKTVEKSIKYMMGGLFVLLLVLVIHALCRKGAMAGVKFFLLPDTSTLQDGGWIKLIHAAMAQAFFTLSLGIGSIAICGSYIGRERSLLQEGFWIILLDTVVAVSAGLIIFPNCMAYGIDPGAGPELIFITLPRVFMEMTGGFFWGALFFIFLAVAAFSTLVAVFENIAAFGMDEFHWSRRKSCLIAGVILALTSLPCILGFNLWRDIQPLGEGSTILDLEDFIVSSNLLPLGALYLTIFCTAASGWGAENFFREVNTGKGLHFPVWMKNYLKFVIPVIIALIWLLGLREFFK